MAVIDRLNVNQTPAFLKDGVFDISEYNNGAVYTDLSDALGQNGENIPLTIRKGGMSVKFIMNNSNYDDRYVQYRLMAATWTTNVADWIQEDYYSLLTIDYDTVEEGFVHKDTNKFVNWPNMLLYSFNIENLKENSNVFASGYVGNNAAAISFYDGEGVFISYLPAPRQKSYFEIQIDYSSIPEGCKIIKVQGYISIIPKLGYYNNLSSAYSSSQEKIELLSNCFNTTVINTRNLKLRNGWMSNNSTWINYDFSNHVTIKLSNIPSDRRILQIQPKANHNIYLVFFKSSFIEPVADGTFNSYLCEGESDRRVLEKGKVHIIHIPSDCEYICIGIFSNTKVTNIDTNFRPENVSFINAIECFDTYLENIEEQEGFVHKDTNEFNAFNNMLLFTYEVFDLTKTYYAKGHVGTNATAVNFYTENDEFISSILAYKQNSDFSLKITPDLIPQTCKYIKVQGYRTKLIRKAPELCIHSNIFGQFDSITKNIEKLDYLADNGYVHVNNYSLWGFIDKNTHQYQSFDTMRLYQYTISADKKYYAYGYVGTNATAISFYDKDRTYISSINAQSQNSLFKIILNTSNIPSNAALVRVQGSSGHLPVFMDYSAFCSIIDGVSQVEQTSLKVLCVGNSFTRDSMSYVPIILKSIYPNIDMTFAILYRGSCSLQMHWEGRTTVNATFDLFTTGTNVWTSSSKKLSEALAYTDWDIVTYQQSSNNSMDYTTYQPYLNNLIEYMAGICHNCTIGWLLTHSWADGYSGLISREITSDEMSERIKVAAKKVMDETTVNLLFPYGTAIQNARHNETLNALGDGGSLCYTDKVHLQEGLPCQIAAYTNTLVFLDYLKLRRGLNGNIIRVDSAFETQYNIPEQNGSPVGSTDANCVLAQKAASLAVKNPYVISGI